MPRLVSNFFHDFQSKPSPLSVIRMEFRSDFCTNSISAGAVPCEMAFCMRAWRPVYIWAGFGKRRARKRVRSVASCAVLMVKEALVNRLPGMASGVVRDFCRAAWARAVSSALSRVSIS